MKKLFLFLGLVSTSVFVQADPGDVGPVTVINTIRPKNHAFPYVVISSEVFVATTPFTNNLGSADITVQHALETIDQMTISTGGVTGNFIKNQNTLQSGATFYVSSGTAQEFSSVDLTNSNNATFLNVSTMTINLTTMTFQTGTDLQLQYVTPSSYLAVDPNGNVISTTTPSGGGGGMTPGSTMYIQNTSSLQSGATFYVSSGTVAGNLRAGSFYGNGANLTNLPSTSPGGNPLDIQFNNYGSFGGSDIFQIDTSGAVGPSANNVVSINGSNSFANLLGISMTDLTTTPLSIYQKGFFSPFSPGWQTTWFDSNGNLIIYHQWGQGPGVKVYRGWNTSAHTYTDFSDLYSAVYNNHGGGGDISLFAVQYDGSVWSSGSVTGQSLTASGLSSGQCVQTGTGGLLTTSGTGPCGTGGGGASTLAVGTGTASNFTTNVTSPTAAISFLGTQFRSIAGGTTNFISLAPGVGTPSLPLNSLQYNNGGAFGGAAWSQIATSGDLLTLNPQAASDVPLVILSTTSQSANLINVKNSAGTIMDSIASTGNLTLGDSSTHSHKLFVLDDGNSAPAAYFEKSSNGTFPSGGWDSEFGAFEMANRDQTNGNVEYISLSGHSTGGFSSALIGAVNTDHTNHYGALFFWTRGTGGADARLYIDPQGLVGVGTTSPGAQAHILSAQSTNVGEIIQGASGQSANLTEWRNSSGVAVSSVDANGNITVSTLNVRVNLLANGSSGTSGQVLQSNGAGVANSWVTPSSGGGGITSGSTFYIQNTNSLQSGATFYVSSGTVQKDLNINGFLYRNWKSILISSGTNVFVGENAGDGLNSNAYNTSVGIETLVRNTGAGNSANGYQSLNGNTIGARNSANGYLSLVSNTTGDENVANGAYALTSNTTGYRNVANGMSSSYFGTGGTYNVSNGAYSLYQNKTGFQNTAEGSFSQYTDEGSYNTSVGAYSLYNNTSSGNSALGVNSGGTNINGANLTFLGYNSGLSLSSDRLNSSTAIGYNSQITSSHTMVLGGTGTDYEDVVIGVTSSPGAALNVLPRDNTHIGQIIRAKNLQTGDLQVWQSSTSVNYLRVMASGVISSTGTAPVISSCGTGPSIATGANDNSGTITGGSASTGCTVTFSGSYTNTPSCVVTPQTGSITNTFSYSVSNTALTVTETGLGTGKFDYECRFHEN